MEKRYWIAVVLIGKNSWRLLLNKGTKTIYQTNGKPFSANIIQKIIGKYK